MEELRPLNAAIGRKDAPTSGTTTSKPQSKTVPMLPDVAAKNAGLDERLKTLPKKLEEIKIDITDNDTEVWSKQIRMLARKYNNSNSYPTKRELYDRYTGLRGILYEYSREKSKSTPFIEKLGAIIGSYDEDDYEMCDGEIKEFKQGIKGDCWLLAAIRAISNTPEGRKIIKESITENNDGTVSVHLRGVDKTYKISLNYLDWRMDLATGDRDVRAIEIAVEKYQEEMMDKLKKYGIGKNNRQIENFYRSSAKGALNGNTSLYAIYLLTGADGQYCMSHLKNITKNIEKEPYKYVAVAGREEPKSWLAKQWAKIKNSPFFTIDLVYNHAHAVNSINNGKLNFTNPWDGGSEGITDLDEMKRLQYAKVIDFKEKGQIKREEKDGKISLKFYTKDGKLEKEEILDLKNNEYIRRKTRSNGAVREDIWKYANGMTKYIERITCSDGTVIEL